MAAIGDFGHRASLPSAALPIYPVTLTKPLGLTLTGEVGEIMRLMADQPGMTFAYHITRLPPPAPPNSYNWRLITAGSAPDDEHV